MESMSYVEERPGTWRDLANFLVSSPSIAQWAPIPLRLIVGYGFMEHGFAKAARGFDAFPATRTASQHPDGDRPFDRDIYGAPALWFQLDQASGNNGGRRTVRAAGL
jgi:hypothetical protein